MKTVLITVYCDDQSHPHRQAKVGMFTNHDHVEPETWDLIGSGDFGEVRHSDERLESRVVLQEGDDFAVDQLIGGKRLRTGRGRLRFKLVCPICGLAVTVKDTTLDPILNAIAPHAVPASDTHPDVRPPRVFRVPLGWLAARVTST